MALKDHVLIEICQNANGGWVIEITVDDKTETWGPYLDSMNAMFVLDMAVKHARELAGYR